MNVLTFLKDGDGQFSATRLAFLAWAIGVLIVWMVNSILQSKSFELDRNVVYILGILMTGKVTQAFAENPAGKDGAKSDAAAATIGAAAGAGAAAALNAPARFTGDIKIADGATVSIKDGLVTTVG